MHTHTDTHTHIRSCDRDSKFSAKRNKTKGRLQMADTRHQSTWEPGLGRSHSQRQRQRQRQRQSHCHQTGNEPDEHETRKLSSSNHYSCGVRVGWSRAGEGKEREAFGRQREAKPRAELQFQNLVTANVSRCRWASLSNESNDGPNVRPTDRQTARPSDRIAVCPFDCC